MLGLDTRDPHVALEHRARNDNGFVLFEAEQPEECFRLVDVAYGDGDVIEMLDHGFSPSGPRRMASATIISTPANCPSSNAMAPMATPVLPARNVQPLTIPEPCPLCAGESADKASRGARAYGNARPAPVTRKPMAPRRRRSPASATARIPLPTAISAMPPIMALRRPRRCAAADADRASASRAALRGNSAAPASSAVRRRPFPLWA